MPRYKLTVAYDGTHFHGWQKQQKVVERAMADAANAQHPGLEPADEADDREWPVERIRTVQGVLEFVIGRVIGEPVNLLGASRTDAGVHAQGQVAAFTSQTRIPVEKLPGAISSRLPPDVQVIGAEVVDESFDPISDAIAKGYRYRIAHGCRPGMPGYPLFDRHFITTIHQKLDPELMNEAARRLLGEHDFASFARISHGRESTVRTIYDCKVTVPPGRRREGRCRLDIVGNGFLYNMVRIIAGTLVEIGRGRMPPEQIVQILEARNRDAAGPTMPPDGLCLMWVKYPVRALSSPATE
jgi:tRNA pseudouridine38-40 synthase